MLIPPPVDSRLLTNEFLEINHEADRNLAKMIGVQDITKTVFYQKYALPKLSTYDVSLRIDTSSNLLNEISHLVEEDKEFFESLKKTAFIPTNSGELKAPSALYDPMVPAFTQFMDPDRMYPSDRFSTDYMVEKLKMLGLNSTLSLEGVFQSAYNIELISRTDMGMLYSNESVLT